MTVWFKNRRKVSKSSTALSGIALGAVALAGGQAQAQAVVTPPEGFVRADGIEGIESLEVLNDGSVVARLSDGSTTVFAAADVQVISGQVFLAETAVTAALAGGGAGAGLLIGGLGAGVGAAAAAGGGGGESSPPPPPPPPPNVAPTFTSGNSARVAENQTSAYTATATDANGDVIRYSLAGEDAGLFEINDTTGEVAFRNAPDFEAPEDANGDNDYEITVIAFDGEDETRQDVTITVTNENDNAPVFDSATAVDVSENQTAAYQASATDADGDTLTYSISGDDAALFDIDAATGEVTFKSAPDFEAPGDADADNAYQITVTASDGENSTDQAVTITVTNENDNAPTFTTGTAFTVDENVTEVFQANALDPDRDSITYSLSGDDAALFDIDASNGRVSFKTPPDFENPADTDGDNVYDVTVIASDGQNQTQQAVTITVENLNDEPPVITAPTDTSIEVAEGTLFVVDADAIDTDDTGEPSDFIDFTLSGIDAGQFDIDNSTGRIVFAETPDFEAPTDANGDNVYEVTLRVSDGSLEVTELNLTITVTNENDTAPSFSSGNAVSVEEGQTAAYDADATDPDGNAITYSLLGDDAALFDIDAATGEVTFKTAPDFEAPADADSDNDYQIIVRASDGADEVDQAVTITVTNVVEGTPSFTSPTTATAEENQTLAYDAEVNTADGGALTFSISGTDAGLFDIDATTGVVTFLTAPDFEMPSDANADNDYEITVSVFDGTQTIDQNVVITVTDAAEPRIFDIRDVTPDIGFRIQQGSDDEEFGADVTSAGDIDGDGLEDFIVMANSNDRIVPLEFTGVAYVIYGSDTGHGTLESGFQVLRVEDLSPDDGFLIIGDRDWGGGSVASAGDVNGDGFNDIIIGGNESGGPGAFIVFGSADGFGVTVDGRQIVDLVTLPGSAGFVIKDFDSRDVNVSSAGDLNGDGIDDLIVGNQSGDDGGTDAGEAYVLFGTTEGFGVDVDGRQVVDLATLDSSQGFIIQGDVAGDFAGWRVNTAGDINGDGFEDLVVSALTADGGGDNLGEAYVIFGSAGGYGVDVGGRQVVDLTNLSASEGFIVRGGTDVDPILATSAGDVNGDGFEDLIVTATSNGEGRTYVIFGSDTGFGSDVGGRQVLELSAVGPADGFYISTPDPVNDAGAAGDVNGDGLDDIILGSRTVDESNGSFSIFNVGEVYVLYGSVDAPGEVVDGKQVVDMSEVDEKDGFTFRGRGDFFQLGSSVSGAGDINGDGFDDVAVGAFEDTRSGNAYLIYGAETGSASGVTETGTSAGEILLGSAANDIIDGEGGADVIRTGAGDDVIGIDDASFFRINAGNGFDTLRVDGTGVDLDFTALSQNAVQEIEAIDLTGSGDNALTLTALDLFDMMTTREDGTAILRVTGDSGDSVTLTDDGWTADGTIVEGSVTYNRFTNGNAELRVEDGVSVTLPTTTTSVGDPVVVDDASSIEGAVDGVLNLAQSDIGHGLVGALEHPGPIALPLGLNLDPANLPTDRALFTDLSDTDEDGVELVDIEAPLGREILNEIEILTDFSAVPVAADPRPLGTEVEGFNWDDDAHEPEPNVAPVSEDGWS